MLKIIVKAYLSFSCYSPEGKKCRSKPQMLQYLPENFDIENFDFRAGTNLEHILRKRKRRKDGFNFGKDFNMSGSRTKPTRQTKKSRESIPISVVNMADVEDKKRKIKSKWRYIGWVGN